MSQADLERRAIKDMSILRTDEALEALSLLEEGTREWPSPREQERLREAGHVVNPGPPRSWKQYVEAF